ncbi:DUF7715 family protein [Cryobacterium lactosi]|uniref:DUF7715 family protein n=1 Tax=Cryobacterium lactosi TaxID=1259202 RepID=UPI003B96BFC4
MRVLVATSATQGTRASDSIGCVEGELVWLRDVCPASAVLERRVDSLNVRGSLGSEA